MSKWLKKEQVLVGKGSGESSPCTPRQRGALAGSPRSGQGRGLITSPREGPLGLVQPQTMGEARELFVLCDKEGKGFITKRDMQTLQGEMPLSPDQLESVFESLDRENNGFLTPVEFSMGLGELMGEENVKDKFHEEEEKETMEEEAGVEDVDPGGLRFTQTLSELGADKLFKDQQELSTLWCDLQRERPDLLNILEDVLVHTLSQLQDSLKERDSLEQALRRRESEHDMVVRSMYEEMESQVREEREKRLAQDSIRQWDRRQQLQEELKARELELESTLAKMRELETRVQLLSGEHGDIRVHNQQLQNLNLQLQEQLEASREQLQRALDQLNSIQANTAQEHISRQINVMKVSKNMQKEKDSLTRQLELLRDMNQRLRDEKDAHQSQKRIPNIRKRLQKKGSIIGNYLQEDKPFKRLLSSSSQSDKDTGDMPNTSKRRLPTCDITNSCHNDVQTGELQARVTCPQRVFKVVFLGNSGVGKSSFIQHYCTGQFSNTMRATVGLDFQMKSVTLGPSSIVLQLWDTAGQERFRSITQQYYRRADGILAMYDITHFPSFTAVRGWLDEVQEKKSEGAVVMLLGNKLDTADAQKREVSTREGRRLAEQYQAVFYECSGRSGYNMEELMTQLAGLLATQQDRQCQDTLLLIDPSTSRGGCCQ
ncbi:EF-hand calcium-binding domain-containing protein 4A isoform X2 [Hypomesus transpacificus]|uniref:EF-hand calcium-binding domain-containing protein 4A isoform X2 n=1 Tax=Hypomesus transpacificus TaxID=137520 RepID=UPI001F07A240|nr:EF-hand calcium-binding domain-containing protein 4A isoform X2 [Hypomesus transpacificus]